MLAQDARLLTSSWVPELNLTRDVTCRTNVSIHRELSADDRVIMADQMMREVTLPEVGDGRKSSRVSREQQVSVLAKSQQMVEVRKLNSIQTCAKCNRILVLESLVLGEKEANA